MTAIDLGARIRAFRKAAKLNQAQLGEQVGVGQPTVSMWESDEYDLVPKLSVLQKVADACNVDLQFLMFGPVPEQTSSKAPEADAG